MIRDSRLHAGRAWFPRVENRDNVGVESLPGDSVPVSFRVVSQICVDRFVTFDCPNQDDTAWTSGEPFARP